ncbi:unnamed protein product [Diamesa serratosioi]
MKTFAICALVLLAVSVKVSKAEHHQHPEHHKKDPMGFFGSRGKRSITELPSTVDYNTNSDEANLREWSDMKSPIDGAMLQREIRAPKGFFGMRGKKGNYETWEQDKRALIGLQNLRDRSRLLTDQQFSAFSPKRAPAQGFFGMRGKKYGDYDQINGFLENFDGEDNEDQQYSAYDLNNFYERNEKRAPSGFMGMRGKKASNNENKMSSPFMFRFLIISPILCDQQSAQQQQRNSIGFLGTRGKRSSLELSESTSTLGNSISDESLEQTSFGDNDYQYKRLQEKRVPSGFMGMRGKKYYGFKRAPSGFMGMRGKKNYEEMNELEKRAPSGFMGMRGKKSINNNDYFESDKRAPMGFQGVRGKKSQFENFLVPEDKRGPVTGFFGMRGKKQPNTSSYFGVRKKPYEFRGKFVGVRGKKTPDGSFKTLTLDFNGLQRPGELTPAQLVNSETNSHNKRLGFIGMRGRK